MGFMGSGKSTMGRWIAEAIGWEFIDLDTYIENRHHQTIPQIFKNVGEDGFRVVEQKCLAEVSVMENVIIGSGGGAPCFFDNLTVMKETGLTLYLQLKPQEIIDRLKTSHTPRPLLKDKTGGELLAFINDKLAEREPFYTQAHILANAKDWSVDEFVAQVKPFIL